MHRLIQTLIIAYCCYNSQPHPTTVLSVHYSTAHLLDGLLQVEEAEDSNQSANITCMRAHLDSPLKAGSSIDIELYTVHVGLMTPFPAQASQSDPQRVLLEGSHYVASPYPISKQTTKASFAAAVFGTAIETLVCLNQLCCLCTRVLQSNTCAIAGFTCAYTISTHDTCYVLSPGYSNTLPGA